MSELISREDVREVIKRHDLWFTYQSPEAWAELKQELSAIPIVEPTLYGYKLNHLAFVAALLQNKGVTEENLADVLNSVDWIVGMVLEEQRKAMEEALKKVEVKYDEND